MDERQGQSDDEAVGGVESDYSPQVEPPAGTQPARLEAEPARARPRQTLDIERQMTAIVEASDDAIIGKTLEGIVLSWNPGAERMFGYTADEAVGRHLANLIIPSDCMEEYRLHIQRLQRGERIEPLETVRVRKDGQRLDVSLSGSPISNAEGDITHAVTIIRDISEHKRAERELARHEREFRALVENAPDVIVRLDRDLRFLYVNPALERITGLPRESLIGRAAWNLNIPDQGGEREARSAQGANLIRRVFDTGEEATAEFRYQGPNGWRYYQVHFVPELAPDGSVHTVLGMTRDITQQKQAAQRLSFLLEAGSILASSLEYEETLPSLMQLIVPAMADLCRLSIVGEDGLLRQVAMAASDPAREKVADALTGRYPRDATVNNPVVDALLAGKPQLVPEVSDAMLVSAARDDEHLRLLRALNIRSLLVVPLMTRGRILGVITFVSTSPDRVYGEDDLRVGEALARRVALAVDNSRLYRESQRIQDELRRANEAKDEFLGVLSHELRSPLTTLYGGARILRSRGEQLDTDTRQGIYDDMEQQSERMYRIVQDLLALARVELGQEIEAQPVAIGAIIERLVTVQRQRSPEREVVAEVDQDLPDAMAEPTYVEQVLRNLLSNAEKYSAADSPITVQARRSGEEIVISVLDRGIGIAPEDTERIFERFYRSERTVKQVRGFGLGLTLCKRLVEAQGGRIWAEPREGGGLNVTFTLRLH